MLRLNPALLKKIKDVFTDKGIGFPPGLDETDITVRSMRTFLDEIVIPAKSVCVPPPPPPPMNSVPPPPPLPMNSVPPPPPPPMNSESHKNSNSRSLVPGEPLNRKQVKSIELLKQNIQQLPIVGHLHVLSVRFQRILNELTQYSAEQYLDELAPSKTPKKNGARKPATFKSPEPKKN